MTSLTGLMQLTQSVHLIFNYIHDQLFIILHAVNAQYKTAKAESERLLAQAREVPEQRDPGIIEERTGSFPFVSSTPKNWRNGKMH